MIGKGIIYNLKKTHLVYLEVFILFATKNEPRRMSFETCGDSSFNSTHFFYNRKNRPASNPPTNGEILFIIVS